MSCASAAILVVEHDSELGAALIEQLEADGYRVRCASTSEHARALARASPPSLVILGELESIRSSLDLLIEIRSNEAGHTDTPWSQRLPVIVLSSHARESDLLRAFEAGTDDFLTRPAHYLELRARLRALLARAGDHTRQSFLRVGPLVIDPRARAVTLHGKQVQLRRLEYELLLTLASDPERVFTKHELMQLVWGHSAPRPTRTLDSHVSRLRHGLGAHGTERWLINVHGIGYRLI